MMTNVPVSESIGTTDVISHPQSGQKRKGRGKTTGLSIQKKRKNINGKLSVIIPPDQRVAVGPVANDFVTEISVKVFQHARHDVKNWKNVFDLAKDRIIAHILDTFQLSDTEHVRDTILDQANKLYRYRRSRLHDHFKKYATKEESFLNMPAEVNEVEWKFLVEYFISDSFKKMSERNKANKAKQEIPHICGRKSFRAVSFEKRDTNTGKEPNFQKLWELTHMKNEHWVNDASFELNDKVKEIVADQIQENEEEIDADSIANASFVRIMGEKSGYYREQLQAQQKEIEEERRKRESVEDKLIEVKKKLEEEQENRKVMEARLVRDQKMSGLPSAILNIITNSSDSDVANPTSLMNNIGIL
ncbi:hypothetical protein KY290_008080 [Solanum tuberosum]|uniref:Uncharacterized protein n=1 Tax=Solanum tuberosum TaxID=4113 RepID=A0ABQ7W9B8_SOLTU|nr:hypothetical protein KY290_008080 [Solanum tuberosum]